MFDAPVGGTEKWRGEVHKLSVNGGLVNTMLGSKNSLSDVDFATATYLQITVDADNDGKITAADPPLLPRQNVIAAVFASEALNARNAIKLAGADWSAILVNDQGTATSDPRIGYLNGAKLAKASVSGAQIAAKSVSNAQIDDASVSVGKIQDGAISTAKLQNASVTAGKIGDGAVGTPQIADGSVTGSKLADGSVSGSKVAPAGIYPERILRDIAIFSHTKGVDQEGGASIAGWQQRTINTEELRLLGDQSSISLSGDTITLKPGTYYVRSLVPSFFVGRFQAVLRDVTGSPAAPVVALRGTGAGAWYGAQGDVWASSVSWIEGVVTVSSSPRNFQVWQHNQNGNSSAYGLGLGSAYGPLPRPEQNVFTRIAIERLR